jgi:hypothetical protein
MSGVFMQYIAVFNAAIPIPSRKNAKNTTESCLL